MSNIDRLYKIAAKLASSNKSVAERAEEARPWVHRAVTSAIPAAVATNFLIPSDSPLKRKFITGALLAGGAGGLVDMALQRSSRNRRRRKVKVSSVQPGHQILMRKVAAMAGDLRMKGMAGVKRPAFPTEGSKSVANQSLDRAQKPGRFSGTVKPKDLTKPGPSIPQVSPLPR